MSKIGKIFVDSCKEFTRLQSLVTAALLVALHTVMAMYLSIMVTDSLRISISFLANVAIGAFFGPVMGFVCGGAGDIIQFIIKPQGAYFFGWTLNAALAGFIYGLCFYKKFPKKLKVNKDKKEVDNQEKEGYRFTITMGIQVIASVAAIVMWFVAPFGTGGNGLNVLFNAFSQNPEKGIVGFGIIAAILVAAALIMLFMAVTRHFAIDMIVGIVAAFVAILSVYTDKKYVSVEWGFVAIVIILIAMALLALWEIAKKNKLDFGMLVRISIVLFIDTMVVNVFLGTEWCSIMYGKGFEIYFMSRFIKNVVQLPINILLTYYVLEFLRDIRRRIGLNSAE